VSNPAELLFRTDRFNLSKVGDHFINPCCFGEDVAAWLRGKLAERGIVATEPDQEDWGWYIEATHEGRHYFLGIGGNSDEDPSNPDLGEWRIMLERKRSFMERLKKDSGDDGFAPIVLGILKSEPDFKDVHEEAHP
jgi:hypothetical protein